jgi:hypothetical protein
MRKNPFKNILAEKELKDVLVYGMTDILRPIYEPLGRWNKKDRPIITKYGKEFWLHGVYDYNTETGKYDIWSGINFFNTNYSMLMESLEILENKGINIQFSESKDECKKQLRQFLSELYERKEEFFFDGTIKDILVSIHKGTWQRGESHTNNIKNNWKRYWPDAISFTEDSSEKGLVRDMLFGIDAVVHFEGGVDKTIQSKGCIKIEKENGKYKIYCVVDYSKYEDISYFSFYPSNENKTYIFNNDKNLVQNITENDEPVFIIDESLIHFEGEK